MVPVDILRGESHDMLSDQMVPGNPGEDFGVIYATPEEEKKLHDDDILMWCCLFLYMITVYLRRVREINAEVIFGLEHPASPREFMPEVVSWWDTTQWKDIAREFDFVETTFNQGQLVGLSSKPTTFGGNLKIYVSGVVKRQRAGSIKVGPGLMSMVASALVRQVEKPTVMSYQVRYFLAAVLTWRVPKGTEKMKKPEEEPVPDVAPASEEQADEPKPLGDDGWEAEEVPLAQLPDEARGPR